MLRSSHSRELFTGAGGIVLRNPHRQDSSIKWRLATACLVLLFPLAFLPLPCHAQGVITTVAGSTFVFRGDGGPATDASLGFIQGLALDSAGNVFAADSGTHLVVKISPTGVLTVVAGNEIRGFSGDGGPATSASLNSPFDVAVDAVGNLYIADRNNHRIRKVSPDGTITTVAGNGNRTRSIDGEGGDPADDLGDGGPASSASLNSPFGVAVDATGNLYIADRNNNRIRKVSPDGIITTVAGTGIGTGSIDGEGGDPADDLGDGGPASSASLNQPRSIAVDAGGNLYIADTFNSRVRKVSLGGMISTVAGTGIAGFSGDDVPATSAQLNSPPGVAVDSVGNLYIADTNNHRIRKVSPEGTITTVAGSGEEDFSGDDGLATSAALTFPNRVTVDTAGNLYIADTGNLRIRKVSGAGIISTVAGNGLFKFSGDGGAATSATLNLPRTVAVDAGGNLYIADSLSSRVRKVSPDGIITTVAGNGQFTFSGDGGPAINASLKFPSGVATDSIGNFYIADTSNHRIRRVGADGIITTVAGNGTRTGSIDGEGGDPADDLGDDGPASSASLHAARSVALDAAGNVFIADRDNNRIRKVSPAGIITTVAGNGVRGFSGDGGPATDASLSRPRSAVVDAAGNLFIADRDNDRIRKVSPGGVITTVAGNGVRGFSGDGGPATDASLNRPGGVGVDAVGNIYIADTENHRIRKVGTDGIITTVAGSGDQGFSGDGGPATSASLDGPSGLAVDAAGNLYLADTTNDRIRVVLPTSPSFSVAPLNLSFSGPAGAPEVRAQEIAVSSPVAGLAWSAQASTESGGDWLSVSPTSGSVPGTISVTVDVASLAPETYRGTVTVEAPLAAPALQTVAVELTVTPGLLAQLAVEPSSISFEGMVGEDSLPGQTLRISNAGGETLEWTLQAETTSGGNWLVAAPTSGTASAGSPATVQVSANVTGLAAGVYSGSVQVESTATGESLTVAVTLLLSGVTQTILVSQSGLLFTGVEGGGVVPSQSFGILNTGQGVMSWTVRAETLSGGSWLSVPPASGQSEAESLEIPVVEVAVNATGISAGRYSGLIRIEAPGANNSPQFVSVGLNVLAPGSNPGVLVRPPGLIFAAQAGTSSPGSQRVRLGTAAPGSVEAVGGVLTFDPRTVAATGCRRSLQTVKVLFLVVGTAGVAGESEPHTLASGFDSEAQQECAPQQLLAVHRTLGSNFASPVGFPTPIQAQVVDDCGEAVGNATVVASFSSGDPPLVLASLRNGIYAGTWVPTTQMALVTVTVRASLPPLADAVVQAQGAVQANPTAPVLFSGGVVSGASFAPGEAVAPGSIVSVFGSNLASGLNHATQLPLETTLGGATLNIGGVEAPLFFSSGGQVNAQIPFELAPNSRPHVVVQTRRDGSGPEAVTVPETITLAEARPGIFSINQQGTGQGAILDAQGRLVDSAAPAAAGEIIQVFCTGLGATNPQVASGEAAPAAEPLARVVVLVEAQVGGQPATVHFAGLAPGFVGLYQVNVEIPAEVEPGPAVPLLLLQNGVPSNTVTVAVQ